MPGTPVSLDSAALYICTIPLVAGKFHWSLIHIDDNGVSTHHQWAAHESNPQGPEAYVEQALPGGPLSTSRSQILGYFRVADYPPTDINAFRAICRATFPHSYPTAQENRAQNITCRTWVTCVLQNLAMPENRAREVESRVTALSKNCETEYLMCYIRQKEYQVVVERV